ncbi:MAG: DDE-type integrase/transposase/recombinase [Candidatus Woesearchaeota archaeon]
MNFSITVWNCDFPKLFPLQDDFHLMKLDNGKIEQICKRFDTGKVSINLLSQQFNVSTKRIKQILSKYEDTGQFPKLKKVGRPCIDMDPSTKQQIVDVYNLYKRNALNLQKILDEKFGIKVSKNKIHAVLRESGLAQSNIKKSKPRKKVRYERQHSNSLWHVDWHYLKSGNGYLIGIIDDASRRVFALEYPTMSVENTIDALNRAFTFFRAKPKELMSDNGVQFRQLLFNKKGEINHQFQLFCENHKIKQIFTRKSRPQTNGKIERWFGTYEQKISEFSSTKELVEWYNWVPHMSLSSKFRSYESPDEAYFNKMSDVDIFSLHQEKIFN